MSTRLIKTGIVIFVVVWIVLTETALRPLQAVGLEPEWLGYLFDGLSGLLEPLNATPPAVLSDNPLKSPAFVKPVWYGLPAFTLFNTALFAKDFGVIPGIALIYVAQLAPLSLLFYPRKCMTVFAPTMLPMLPIMIGFLGYAGYEALSPGPTIFGILATSAYFLELFVVMPIFANASLKSGPENEF